ncbi:hypothetical protein SAMN05216337_109615 [Bradyrhizobium brasilense]|uniref:Uncharacterized protein n=1 Tax=Bradyrhizobium brasilense TaxID=1419277 RepID=A0A1G7QFA6_9BRAD|nr:hypothetical protein [Bradyrhizobium brasilense]SDF97184.1 hypothetical protein SAMN05216337_109615 [Bradyrhizobium brasilense]
MLDQNNGYEFAGPGRKRRERLALANIEQSFTPRTIKQKTVSKSLSERTPKRETRDITERGLKSKIRLLTLQTETFKEVCDELRRANISASGILVSNQRTAMREIIALLTAEGLIDEQRLEHYRRQYKRDRKG